MIKLEDRILHIIITPCLLGFDVKTYVTAGNLPGRGFIHDAGLYESFGKLILDLLFTEDNYVIELH